MTWNGRGCLWSESRACLLTSKACGTLRKNCPARFLPPSQRADMTISLTLHSSARLGLRVFVLLLAWSVVVGLSWVELLDLQDLLRGTPTEVQLATEPDLDEIRHDVMTIPVVGAHCTENLTVQPPLVCSVPQAAEAAGNPVHHLLSQLSVYRL
jgi:hypothetical protein